MIKSDHLSNFHVVMVVVVHGMIGADLATEISCPDSSI